MRVGRDGTWILVHLEQMKPDTGENNLARIVNKPVEAEQGLVRDSGAIEDEDIESFKISFQVLLHRLHHALRKNDQRESQESIPHGAGWGESNSSHCGRNSDPTRIFSLVSPVGKKKCIISLVKDIQHSHPEGSGVAAWKEKKKTLYLWGKDKECVLDLEPQLRDGAKYWEGCTWDQQTQNLTMTETESEYQANKHKL